MSMTISGKRNSYHGASPLTVEDTQSLSKYYEKNEEFRDVESEYEGRESLNKKIHVYTGDMISFSVDAIVCSVQSLLTCKPYGMHSEVMRRAGEVYKQTVRDKGYCKPGQAFITDGYDLHAKYIIHTAGPPPDTSLDYEGRQSCLRKSYLSCLDIVGASAGIRSIAVPCLGSGGGGLQLKDAVSTAVTTIRQWLETDNNHTQVDSIILVMCNVGQLNEYMQELCKIFPYGRDLAGIDLEMLTYADESIMSGLVPETMHSTNILCYKYNKHSVKIISKHFHSLVSQIHRKLGTRSKPPERFKNCGRIFINSAKTSVVVYHGTNSFTLEVHVSSKCFELNICRNVQSLIDNYLSANLENVTEYNTYIRCDNSSWGDLDGLLSTYKIQRKMSRNSTVHCRHRKSANNKKHSVDVNEVGKFWIHKDQTPLPREPSEHNEMAEGSVGDLSCTTMTSVASLERSKQKQGITIVTRPSPCHPVENSDESQSMSRRDRSSVSNQDLTYSACSNSGNNQLSSYQPLNDSLLATRHKQYSCDTNKYCQNQDRRSLQAWESEPSEHCQCRTHGKLLKGSNEYRCSGKCENDVKFTQNEPQNSSSSSLKQRCSECSDDDKCDCGGSKNRCNTRSSFCDLNLGSLVGACGGVSHGHKSEDNTKYCGEMSSLSDQALIQIARVVGIKDTQLGLELGLPYACIQRIKSSNSDDAVLQTYHILREWKIQQRGKACIETLKDALINCSIDISSLNI